MSKSELFYDASYQVEIPQLMQIKEAILSCHFRILSYEFCKQNGKQEISLYSGLRF